MVFSVLTHSQAWIKQWTEISFRTTYIFVAEEAVLLHEYFSYIFSERGTGIFSVTNNQELMITADLSDRQHSVCWPHGAIGLSKGEQHHLLNQQNHFKVILWKVAHLGKSSTA